MYEKGDEGCIDFSYNLFLMLQGGFEVLNGDLLKVYVYQYDLVCNGYELILGGICNYKLEIMFKVFELVGYGKDEVEKCFGGMVKVFCYGVLLYGGCVVGIDWIVMLLVDEQNICEVIMFLMNQCVEDLMMGVLFEFINDQMCELWLWVLLKE